MLETSIDDLITAHFVDKHVTDDAAGGASGGGSGGGSGGVSSEQAKVGEVSLPCHALLCHTLPCHALLCHALPACTCHALAMPFTLSIIQPPNLQANTEVVRRHEWKVGDRVRVIKQVREKAATLFCVHYIMAYMALTFCVALACCVMSVLCF